MIHYEASSRTPTSHLRHQQSSVSTREVLTLESPGESICFVPQSTMLEIILKYLIGEESRVLIGGILVFLDDIS